MSRANGSRLASSFARAPAHRLLEPDGVKVARFRSPSTSPSIGCSNYRPRRNATNREGRDRRFVYALTSIFSLAHIRRVESVFEIIAEPNRRAILSLLVTSEQ